MPRSTSGAAPKVHMRTAAELRFRLRQEGANLALYLRPPVWRGPLPATPLPALPDPAAVAASLRGTPYTAELLALADNLLAHRIPLLGHAAITPARRPAGGFAWRRDPLSGAETPLRYFRLVPYLDPARAGDQKLIWELNRHSHLVLLAQAHLLSGDPRYLAELSRQLEDWPADNPFQQGMNWTAALEAAFRALSWIWIYHLAGPALSESLRRLLVTSLLQHGHHLDANLSIYSSPNTHLLGEAVALHAVAHFFPAFPLAEPWRQRSRRLIHSHLETHVLPDGLYFEQSTYYHLYALDMFVFHALLEPPPPAYLAKVARMAEIAGALAGPAGLLPFLGDDDGGRFFHPFGDRATFVRGSLGAARRLLPALPAFPHEDSATLAAWWFGPPAAPPKPAPAALASRLFPVSGLAVLTHASHHIVCDTGTLGTGTAGHSHADSLSLTVHHHGHALLLDPGTYSYLTDPAARQAYRSTSAHNTISIDGLDQATPVHAFRWADPPATTVEAWQTGPALDWLSASCRYRGFTHHRQLVFLKEPALLFVLDRVEGPGAPALDQFWHAGPTALRDGDTLLWNTGARLHWLTPGAAPEFSPEPYSPAFGLQHHALCLRVRRPAAPLPFTFAAVLDFTGRAQPAALQNEPNAVVFPLAGGARLTLPLSGASPQFEGQLLAHP